jgi:hypothetical protein
MSEERQDYARGGYIDSCRPGDIITWNGENYRVTSTWANAVQVEPVYGGLKTRVYYQTLRESKAFFAARLIPCLPPEGETKL